MTEHTIETLKELIEARLTASEKAMALLSIEILRRLNELNNSHALAIQKEQTFVGRVENTAERNTMVGKIEALTKTQNMMVGGLFLLQILMTGLLYFMRGPV